MFDDSRSFVSRAFLQSIYDIEFKAYLAGGRDEIVHAKLKAWDGRAQQTETQDESAFIQAFFVELWGFGATGLAAAEEHTIIPKFGVQGAGAKGGAGEADLALGWFKGRNDAVPQALCEFKDIRSDLDTKQNRKGSNLTPVEQCLNYVRGARRNLFGNESVQPWWGVATDMNEFRLYWWDRAPQQYLRFSIAKEKDLFVRHDLLSDGEAAQFDRFLFTKLFRRDMLIAQSGKPALWRLVERQWLREAKIEEEFYDHYKAVRERLFNVLRTSNTSFRGTPTDLLRISQKLLDRFIFTFYCEDMGERMLFPPQFIRDYLKNRSTEPYYETEGSEIWDFFRRLFTLMNTGGRLGATDVPHINGGLFDTDELIDGLQIPNHVFAALGQGQNDAAVEADKTTLFYLSARYNYASKGDAKESLSLYTLGRIFEQSITELEFRVGELEGRETVAKLSKRKRDGVYYTPEWVVNYLVEETLAPWFKRLKAECGYPADGGQPQAAAARAYLERLRAIRIVDPACGSGAFLISAFRRLLDERKSVARDIAGDQMALDETELIADILQNNIYGVDINPSSVEIAKLALWLHSARAKAPLSSLDHTIRCGNSLVGPDYWTIHGDTPEARARVNPFDWEEAFPEVRANGGFDIVLGNPPYVKLQNLMKVDPDVAVYLQTQRASGTYESAQTGNFDLYLPFIEKGLRLLNGNGRMAYIAPNLWAVNEYGRGLRALLHRTRQLERWIDFKSFQVFEEAITYTALQFFTHEPNDVVKVAISPDGEVGDIDWSDEALAIPAASLRDDTEWLMATGEDRALIERLSRDCLRLDDPAVTSTIFQGLITSADKIYHLKRIGNNTYECSPLRRASYVVELEDAIMKPLVSGAEAKRFETPETETFLLFPYERDGRANISLITSNTFQRRFPRAWAYLLTYESELREREGKSFDDDSWYRFGRNQSIDKQELQKLIVAQTVPELRVCADYDANKYLNNVRVNGILPATNCNMSFLMATLNGQVADFVFRRIGKPKQGGWFEANKQFIAPLPIPRADAKTQKTIGAQARDLQERWTNRRDLLAEAEARLSVLGRTRHATRWLWPDLPDMAHLKEQAPRGLRANERTDWIHAQLADLEDRRVEALQGILDSGGQLDAGFANGELKLFSRGATVLGKIYLDEAEGRLTEAYWRYLILSKQQRDAKSFASHLRRPPAAPDTPAARQFMEKVDRLVAETEAIRLKEHELNELLYDLYKLSHDERLLIEKDCARRPLL
ncbi:MAG: Eco57I restriction-modification methylase domain-containing protein [Aestuariivirga sp.]|nr:Eco57I restriction-modification methylase domain-containing protein [Aestuariivirga sp.]